MGNHVWVENDPDGIDNMPYEAMCILCGCMKFVRFTEMGISVEFFEKDAVLPSATTPPCDNDPFREYAEIVGPSPDIDINREK